MELYINEIYNDNNLVVYTTLLKAAVRIFTFGTESGSSGEGAFAAMSS